jgi:pilus assembly protein Flp/PilA
MPMTFMEFVEQFSQNENGATAIEYGLIAALIALACIIAFTSLGLNLANIFNTISNALR